MVLTTARGMALRFREDDARSMGRNTSGVKGIKIDEGDQLVGMVVADPDATLLTTCLHGYGKRTNFGPNSAAAGEEPAEDDSSSSARYRTQRRGGKGLRDIKATDRNGQVIGITSVTDDDEILMMTARGKIQRIRAAEINVIGRNTQGVRIITLDEDDTLTAVVRVPRDDNAEAEIESVESAPPSVRPPAVPVDEMDADEDELDGVDEDLDDDIDADLEDSDAEDGDTDDSDE